MLIDKKTKDEVFKQTRLRDIFDMARNYQTRHYFNIFENQLNTQEEQKEFIRIKSTQQVKDFLKALKTRVNNLQNLAGNPSGCKLHRPELDITQKWIAELQIGIFKILQMNSDTRVPIDFSSSVEEVLNLLEERDKVIEIIDALYLRLMMTD